MLGKLIKHEFKATYWEFTILFIVALGIAGMEKIFIELNSDNPIIAMFSILFTIMYVICIIGLSLGSIVLVVKRFYVNMVKDQGYLSFTLPVSVSQHIMSKLIVSVVWTIATNIVMVAMIGIMFIGNGLGEFLKAIVELVKSIGDYGMWGYVFEGILIIFVSLFVTGLQYYMCIAIGQMIGKHKVLGSIAAYFANGMIINFIATLIMVIVDRAVSFDQNIEQMSGMEIVNTYGASYLHIFLIFMSALAVIYFFITKISLEKKLNLE